MGQLAQTDHEPPLGDTWNSLETEAAAMMSPDQRERALVQMQQAATAFYRSAVSISNHPFIEFAGLMNEYINACRQAHARGIDFTECNVHTGQVLPLHPVMSDYLNEKLECIFSGSKILDAVAVMPEEDAPVC